MIDTTEQGVVVSPLYIESNRDRRRPVQSSPPGEGDPLAGAAGNLTDVGITLNRDSDEDYLPVTIVEIRNVKRKGKSKGKSPTQRSLEHWRGEGYLCAVVERWNPHARIRQDLYGFIDVLAIKGDDIVGIQATAQGVSSRVHKITEHENFPVVIAAMRIVVDGWRKNSKGRWIRREIEL